MTERELRAVAEAIADAAYTNDILGRGGYSRKEWLVKYGSKYQPHAQAAISASDSKYVKGLVEALNNLRYGIFKDEAAVNECIDTALQQLPEDLLK